jgi:hypothetical protein
MMIRRILFISCVSTFLIFTLTIIKIDQAEEYVCEPDVPEQVRYSYLLGQQSDFTKSQYKPLPDGVIRTNLLCAGKIIYSNLYVL